MPRTKAAGKTSRDGGTLWRAKVLTAYAAGRAEEAEAALARARAKASPEEEWLVHAWKAVLLRQAARPFDAVIAANEALRANPEALWPLAVRGEALRELGAGWRGFQDIQWAVQKNPAGEFARAFLDPDKSAWKGGRRESWVYAVLGAASRSLSDLPKAQLLLQEAVRLDERSGLAWGWLGETALRQGALSMAGTYLNRAQMFLWDWPDLHHWRGEWLRLSGRPREAEASFSRAIAAGAAGFSAVLARASVREELGDLKGQEEDFARAVRLAPDAFRRASKGEGGAAAATLRPLLLKTRRAALWRRRGQRALEIGEPSRALERFDRALACDPDDQDNLIARARAHRALMDADSARRDLDAAVALCGAAAVFQERAEFLVDFGYVEEALYDYTQALALQPNRAYYRYRRAKTLFGMRLFEACLGDLGAAVALEPDYVDALELRSYVNIFLRRWDDARKDIDLILALDPSRVHLFFRRCQILGFQGKVEEGLELLKSAPDSSDNRAWVHFTRGFLFCLATDYRRAVPEFDKADTLAGEQRPQLKSDAALYALAAQLCLTQRGAPAMSDAAKTTKGRLLLCGLGVDPPASMTIQVLQALRRCDAIFNNLPGASIYEFLSVFCPDVRPIEFRYEEDVPRCADLICSAIGPGKTIGFVTFGNPVMFGPLAHELFKRSKKGGVECVAFSAISSLDAMLAASGTVMGFSFGGYQVLETNDEEVLARIGKLNPKLPLLAYFVGQLSQDRVAHFFEYVHKTYPPGHEAFLFEPKSDQWQKAPQKVALRKISQLAFQRLVNCMLFIPPVEAAAGRERVRAGR